MPCNNAKQNGGWPTVTDQFGNCSFSSHFYWPWVLILGNPDDQSMYMILASERDVIPLTLIYCYSSSCFGHSGKFQISYSYFSQVPILFSELFHLNLPTFHVVCTTTYMFNIRDVKKSHLFIQNK